MAGTNILVRQKDLIAGSGISITPDTTSGNVTIAATNTAIDEARLLPTGGKNGNILEYQEGADRGNNVNTKLLLQPATSDGLIVDQAVGNAAPVDITNSGNVVIEDNALVFTGTNSLLIPANALGMTLGGNNEFMIDIEFQLDSVKSDYATLYGSDGGGSGYQGALYFTSGGAAHFTMGLGPSTTGWTLGTKHRITIERWNDNGTWKTSVYRNGSFLASSTSGMNTLSDYVFPIGSNTDSTGRNFVGKIWAFRISNKAEHRGVSFTPRELPFLPPAGQPVWTEGIDRSRLLPENPANGDIPCFDATATVGGGNDANTRILLHFDADEIKDEAAGNAAPVTITKKTGTITVVEGGKWGKCAKYVTGSMTVATNLDELNANNWVVSGWFNPDENNHGVSYPTWLSMDDQNTHGFGFDSTGRYGESDGPLFYLDTPPASGTWHWLAIVKYSGGLRFYLNGAFLNEISAQQRANFCSTLAIGGFAGTYAAGSTERTFSGLVDEVRLQYIPDDEITQWTGTSIAVPDAPYSKPQTVGEWGKFNKAELVKSVNGQLPDSSGVVTLPAATASAAGLMAATDKAAIAGLTAHGIYPVARSKTGAVDFNEVIDHGFYFIEGDTPHLNYPETYAQTGGTLQVIRAGAYLTQTFIPIVSQSMAFIRHCINVQSDLSGRTFSTWRRLLTAPDITESKALPGYFKLPGGTIVQWGKKTAITRDEENCYISFPIAFPTMFLSATAIASSGTLSATGVIVSLSEASTTSMTMVVKNHPNTGSPDMDQYIEMYWFAVGF